MTRRRWAAATYRLARAVGHDRVMSLAMAWQAFRYGPETAALLAAAEVNEQAERLVMDEDYIETQREASLMQ